MFDLNLRSEDAQERLFLLCREGLTTDAMNAFHNYAKLFNQYTVAQAVLSDTVLNATRKEIRRLFPEIKVEADQLRDMLANDVLKRDVVDSENAREAAGTIKRINAKAARAQAKSTLSSSPESDSATQG